MLDYTRDLALVDGPTIQQFDPVGDVQELQDQKLDDTTTDGTDGQGGESTTPPTGTASTEPVAPAPVEAVDGGDLIDQLPDEIAHPDPVNHGKVLPTDDTLNRSATSTQEAATANTKEKNQTEPVALQDSGMETATGSPETATPSFSWYDPTTWFGGEGETEQSAAVSPVLLIAVILGAVYYYT